MWVLLKKFSYLVLLLLFIIIIGNCNPWVLYNRKYFNLIVNVKNFAILVIKDFRYEAVLTVKYLKYLCLHL